MARPTLTLDPPVDPSRLCEGDRGRLTRELFEVHDKIFAGVDRSQFAAYVVEPRGATTRIQVMRDPSGAPAGYMALHSYVRPVAGRTTLVMRGEVGVLPAWRGQTAHARFLLTQTARQCLRHWWRPKLVLACPIHPGSYWGVTRRVGRSWPRPGQPTPPKIARMFTELAAAFGLIPPNGADPLVRRVGWITRESDADREYWANHPAPLVQYYRALNPNYGAGNGLLMLVPLTLGVVLHGAWGELCRRIGRRLRPRRRPLNAR